MVHKKSSDIFWADAYKRFGGKSVISGDCKIAYKPHEASAFIENGLVAVFPSENWMNLYLHEKAVLLAHYWPIIAAKFQEASAATCWRIPIVGKKGEIILKPVELVQLEIPGAVLETARKARAGG